MVASRAPPTADLAPNPGLCPDWKLNQPPFGSQAVTQSTEPHQPGLFLLLIHCSNYKKKTILEKPVYHHTKRPVNNLRVCLNMSRCKSSCHLLNRIGSEYFIILSKRINYTNVPHIGIGLLLECYSQWEL